MSAHDAPPSRPPSEPPPPPKPEIRWSAGIVNHGTYDDLEACIASLVEQSPRPASIVVYDTEQDPARLRTLRHSLPEITFQAGPNCGYAGGANRVIDLLTGAGQSVDFVLVLNPDVQLEPDYVRRLVHGMNQHADVAIGTGKLLRPDRVTLDSAGIVLPRNRRPRDRGSDQKDIGQFDVPEFVDAASGAAMMFRVAALDDLRIEGELFDETFFSYHEDTDLCWRARLFGLRIRYVPDAVGLHRRGWQRDRRAVIPVTTRRHSFKNHYLQIIKNETRGELFRNLPWLVTWEILRFGFVVLRDRPMLSGYREAWRSVPEARRKRSIIQARAKTPPAACL